MGRQNRRLRREAARALAKEIMQDGDTSREKRRGKRLTFLGIGIALASWGYFALAPDPSALLGCLLMLSAFCALVVAFWELVTWTLAAKIPVILVTFLVTAVGGYYWVNYITRPSFTFMVPGVWVNGKTWDFIVNHRGPKTSRSVEILFTDDDRKDTLKNRTSISAADIQQYQQILNYPEVNPMGRGHIFATQFMWTPLLADHEHYSLHITATDRTVHEELQVERVNDKWYYAVEVKDWETQNTLLSCKDPGFPYGELRNRKCFPEIIVRSN